MKRALIGLFTLMTLAAAHAQTPNEVFRSSRKLVTTDAVDEQGLVTVGGIPQWVSVRGRHRSNPLLLVLHGGPAFTVSPVSYYYMRDWEEHFTVVQWDQRGAGKTYAASDPEKVRGTLSVERIVADAEELIGYLRTKYQKERIVLLGHSFGTILGVKLAQRKPEWLHAYVGMGQFTDFQQSEAEGYAATLAAARADKNDKAVAALLSIAPFPDREHPERNVQNLGTERLWLATYGGYYWPGGFGHNGEIARLSPDYSEAELKIRDEAQAFSDQILWDELGRVSFVDATRFKVPVIIFQGRHDRGTSSALVDKWFATLEAPVKKLVWFEDSAHMVYEEEPGKTLVSLVSVVLPLVK
ncbi:MAG TPA: alpha/beta hydrolase [Steroidobacteraceae bacterium]|nr:alpha/beta hydrolase [Steroidobacteraceae bacterium]